MAAVAKHVAAEVRDDSLSSLAAVLTPRATSTTPAPCTSAPAIHEACLGPDHPDTVRSRERLAAVVAALENRP